MVSTILKNPRPDQQNRWAGDFEENKVPDNRNATSVKYVNDGSLLKEIWNGTNWVEGATQEEINIFKKNQYLDKLILVVKELNDRLLVSAVNKEEKDVEYLKGQTERYTKKYNVSKKYIDTNGQEIENQLWYDAILKELQNTNNIQNISLTEEQFMGLIVQYYETGEQRQKVFDTSLEIFRAKTKDFILTYNFNKADECFEMANNIPNNMTIQDLQNLLIQFDSI